MSKITNIEKGDFLSLFNRDGYVLNFSTVDFDAFTLKSVGLALCSHYNLSKGKSLMAYVNIASEENVIKLFSDLLEHYEHHYKNEITFNESGTDTTYGISKKEYQRRYNVCRKIMDRIKSIESPFSNYGENLKEKFSSDYISAQIVIMLQMQNDNPTEAIGKAKELIESCCKTILEADKKDIDKDWTVQRLVKETMLHLEVAVENINESLPEAKIVKAILGNLNGIAGNIAELRNAYGSGHGKSASYRGLTIRHAKLAVGSSITLVNYLWDTYEWRKQKAEVRA